jgi:hypothetical protein
MLKYVAKIKERKTKVIHNININIQLPIIEMGVVEALNCCICWFLRCKLNKTITSTGPILIPDNFARYYISKFWEQLLKIGVVNRITKVLQIYTTWPINTCKNYTYTWDQCSATSQYFTLTNMFPMPLLLASGSRFDHITLIGLPKTRLWFNLSRADIAEKCQQTN